MHYCKNLSCAKACVLSDQTGHKDVFGAPPTLKQSYFAFITPHSDYQPWSHCFPWEWYPRRHTSRIVIKTPSFSPTRVWQNAVMLVSFFFFLFSLSLFNALIFQSCYNESFKEKAKYVEGKVVKMFDLKKKKENAKYSWKMENISILFNIFTQFIPKGSSSAIFNSVGLGDRSLYLLFWSSLF